MLPVRAFARLMLMQRKQKKFSVSLLSSCYKADNKTNISNLALQDFIYKIAMNIIEMRHALNISTRLV